MLFRFRLTVDPNRLIAESTRRPQCDKTISRRVLGGWVRAFGVRYTINTKISGTRTDPVETCTFTKFGQIECKSFITGLTRYEFYPELFLIDTEECL